MDMRKDVVTVRSPRHIRKKSGTRPSKQRVGLSADPVTPDKWQVKLSAGAVTPDEEQVGPSADAVHPNAASKQIFDQMLPRDSTQSLTSSVEHSLPLRSLVDSGLESLRSTSGDA